MFVALSSVQEWKLNQKAALCALQTYDHYQKQHVGSVKYIQRKSSSENLNEPADSVSDSVVTVNDRINTTVKVMHVF